MIADDILTGLRIGGIILFLWLGIRVAFESWGVTERNAGQRRDAWVFFRAALLVMCFVMVFLASPANILLANGYISLQTNFWMMCLVTVGASIYAVLIHHGLDIANNRRPVTWLSCVLIAVLSILFGILRAV